MKWLDDPRVARRLARVSWVVLVVALVVLVRERPEGTVLHAAHAGVIALVGVLNAPVAAGLWRSRAHARTAPFRMVALALTARLLATVWVVWLT